MQTPANPTRRRILALGSLAVACVALTSSSPAQITLTDGNSVALVDPASQQGMFYWAIQGQNQLQQQWFWYSVGNTAPASINTIGAPMVTLNNGTRGMSVTYANAAFNVNINYLLTGGDVVGVGRTAVSDIGETIRIQNTSAAPLPFKFYQYSNFDLGGAGQDTVQLGKNLRGLFNEASQFDPLAGLSETVTTPGANHGEAALYNQTLLDLNGGVPLTLSDSVGPVGPGNATWALEWDFLINPGDTALISKDKYLSVVIVDTPEPSSMALVGLGLLGLVWRRRQREK